MRRLSPLLAATSLLLSIMGGSAMAQSTSSAQSSSSSSNGSSTYSGQITGNGVVQYGLDIQPLQRFTVTLSTSNPSTRMNVLRDGDTQALCEAAGAQTPCTFRAEADASYRVQVYLLKDAAQRGESAQFSLAVEQGR